MLCTSQGGRSRINMTNGAKLQVIESASRINYHFLHASWMVISSPCLMCDSHRVLHSGYQTNHKPRLGSTWSICPVRQALSNFDVRFVPLITFSGWVKSLLLLAQEGRMGCEYLRHNFILFLLFVVMTSLFPYD